MINNKNKNVTKVSVAGKLYAGDEVYYLIHPEPVDRYAWQRDNVFCFLVVPCESINMSPPIVHDFPRHVIVAGTWHIDKGDMGKEINVLAYTEEAYQPSVPETVTTVTDPETGGRLIWEDLISFRAPALIV